MCAQFVFWVQEYFVNVSRMTQYLKINPPRPTFSNAFSWKKMFKFRLKLVPRFQLIISPHDWFRYWLGAEPATMLYMNQSLLITFAYMCHPCIYVSPMHICVTHAYMCHPCIYVSPMHICVTHAYMCHPCIYVSPMHICVTHAYMCHPCIYVSLMHICVTQPRWIKAMMIVTSYFRMANVGQ